MDEIARAISSLKTKDLWDVFMGIAPLVVSVAVVSPMEHLLMEGRKQVKNITVVLQNRFNPQIFNTVSNDEKTKFKCPICK